ncbi:tRNA (adenosine(37)-N6)-threonylcarbamoyltransferase complex dimerization subunit type 1 TsaB [Bythopirellula polymerisocia]|uniref:N(6)-L-threonylcarbamoyladenine synthase n=1 Tax=Bythopirellula polymerisocia TaxID=2528003 RepID=A0A5C6C9V0_9BACT|nr:tRNA (adenosine(37)-N6)-threonylcarbamoyltransferase complex dimerization subunit type 1 TsaB [Bythopirellula polymerisocia]TWU20845.1 tRNA threonylcarbamoyladenosine biosynthesis protein TsaB [Bythopirellula polymerisocia]
MRILAFETSLRQGSIAALESSQSSTQLVAERQLPSDQRSAQSLLPALSQLCSECGWKPAEVELVCVTTGPGSFTGLRIGITAAKALAYAVGAKLVGVHSLAALAAGVPQPSGNLWTILDAQRQELFVASFEEKAITQYPETRILSTNDWLAVLKPGDSVVGPPLDHLCGKLPSGVDAVDENLWQPQARIVGQLGYEFFCRGHTVDPMQLVPNYFRKSAAEEKADAAEA